MDILGSRDIKFDNSVVSHLKFDSSIYQVGSLMKNHIKFTDQHLLQPSLFPNGSVCGHLHEIRSINFTNQCNKNYCRKINIKPVNLRIKVR